MTAAAGAVLVGGVLTLGGPAAWAQDATPEAAEALPARPAHIHSGDCVNLGDVVQPLTDLTAGSGDRGGQARKAVQGENSFTTVPMALDAILDSDHAINVHLSADEIGTYIACGEIGGRLTPGGSLIIGLRELNGSGYTGVAVLTPSADGVSTDVSTFIAPVLGMGQNSAQAPAETTTEATATETATAAASLPSASPAAESDMAGMDMAGTPAAETEMAGTPAAATGGETMMASNQVPVSESEFVIEMPTTIAAGPVTFAVTNDGTITHSFEVEGNGIEEELESPLEPGQTGMLTVDLTPGTYEIYCPIADHESLGMRVEVIVS
jgi:uncharacterized cupredoxin-like copper-binding protein